MYGCHTKKKEKIFKCEDCGKTYGQPAKLKNHIAVVHRGERPHKCDQCDQSFAYKNGLREHKETIHEGIMFTCQFPNCGKQMNRIANLNKHMKTAHGKPLPAELKPIRKKIIVERK